MALHQLKQTVSNERPFYNKLYEYHIKTYDNITTLIPMINITEMILYSHNNNTFTSNVNDKYTYPDKTNSKINITSRNIFNIL